MNKDYKNLIKEEKLQNEENNNYEIYIECDANDGDCMNDTFYLDNLINNELLFLVLCYIHTGSAFGHTEKDGCFGCYVEDDIFFDWMWDYCTENDLLIFAGMCDCYCHSIVDLSIIHNSQGTKYNVVLPTIDKIFDNETEMKNYMDKLYEQGN